MLSGNKGDWSEVYALFKLLGDGKLYAGDADLNKLETLFYPIVKIIRKEVSGRVEYQIKGQIIIITDDDKKLEMPISDFMFQAANLLDKIKRAEGTFQLPEVESFMRSVLCKSIAQSSAQKSDIQIVIYDKRVNQSAELGFSIKSQLGGDSTLFNCNKRKTNFIYKVNNLKLNKNEIKRINSINPKTEKIKKRVEAISELGGVLKFTSLEGAIFNNNLILIDSRMPEMLAEIILTYFSTKYSSLTDLTNLIHEKNPLNFDMQYGHNFYEYKVKHFLTDSALGMTGSKVWSGAYDITGGYLIVKNDGDVLCYHVYNRNQFEDYLFANTKLDTPSSTRHEFGTVYEENEQLYFALNLQIRFK